METIRILVVTIALK